MKKKRFACIDAHISSIGAIVAYIIRWIDLVLCCVSYVDSMRRKVGRVVAHNIFTCTTEWTVLPSWRKRQCHQIYPPSNALLWPMRRFIVVYHRLLPPEEKLDERLHHNTSINCMRWTIVPHEVTTKRVNHASIHEKISLYCVISEIWLERISLEWGVEVVDLMDEPAALDYTTSNELLSPSADSLYDEYRIWLLLTS